jgi:hypothetical protein
MNGQDAKHQCNLRRASAAKLAQRAFISWQFVKSAVRRAGQRLFLSDCARCGGTLTNVCIHYGIFNDEVRPPLCRCPPYVNLIFQHNAVIVQFIIDRHCTAPHPRKHEHYIALHILHILPQYRASNQPSKANKDIKTENAVQPSLSPYTMYNNNLL